MRPNSIPVALFLALILGLAGCPAGGDDGVADDDAGDDDAGDDDAGDDDGGDDDGGDDDGGDDDGGDDDGGDDDTADDDTGDDDTGDDDTGPPFLLELPLTDQAATAAALAPYGGTVAGGTFGADGWTTTTRNDRIDIPLPPGVDASAGELAFSVAGFEWDLTQQYFEQWVLVSLDNQGPPWSSTPTGEPGIQALYRGYNPDIPSRSYRATAYYNLADPACTDWHDCTGEASSNGGFLLDDGTVFTYTHAWAGPVDTVGWSGNGVDSDVIDLTATSPGGAIQAGQFFLMINACGGSQINPCGAWFGPAKLQGGPIGVTYSDLRLVLY